MKRTIGIITLLLLSQSIFAEEAETKQTEASPTETKIIESDTAAVEPAAKMAMKEEQTGFSRGSVTRSAFTTEVADREPTEDLQNLTNDSGHVKFFTELRDMSGQTAIHRWEYDGKVVAEVAFDVKGSRWRVWSSKNLSSDLTGDWKVSVVNGAGEVISEKNLSYDVAAAPVAPAMTSPDTETTNTPAESMQ
jgi:hypothetical protein